MCAPAPGDADFAEGDPVPAVLDLRGRRRLARRAATPRQQDRHGQRDRRDQRRQPGQPQCRHPATHPSGGPSAAETTAATGRKCQWGEAVWGTWHESPATGKHLTGDDPLDGFSPATRAWFDGAFAEPTPAQVGRVAGDRQGRGHAGRRADRFGQDAGRVPVGDRPAGGGAAARGPEAAHPGALRLPAQGAGRRHRAEPARAADRDRARRAPARPGRAGHQGGGAHRRHRGRGAQEAGQSSRRTS